MLSVAELLQELVKRPSVNPMGRTDLPASILFENRVADFIEEQLRTAGADYRRVNVAPGRDNVIATFTPNEPTSHILFEAHQDTVPVDGMTIDPFGGTIADGKLSGRGACDVKAGLAAMLFAFLRLVKESPKKAAKVTVAFTIDEEHTFLGVQQLVDSGFKADFAIVAEPTKLDIVTSHKGVARWTTTVQGVACHSSKPHHGVNAIYRMAKVVTAIEEYAAFLKSATLHLQLGLPTLSVGVIHGGTASNIVPDACSIEVDRRLLPGETAASALKEFEAELKRHSFAFEVTNELTFACPALEAVPNGNANLRRLRAAIEGVRGPAKLISVPFGTDASSLAEAGIPSVVFGPGDIAQAHTKDEWVNLAEVEAAAEILYRFAIS